MDTDKKKRIHEIHETHKKKVKKDDGEKKQADAEGIWRGGNVVGMRVNPHATLAAGWKPTLLQKRACGAGEWGVRKERVGIGGCGGNMTGGNVVGMRVNPHATLAAGWKPTLLQKRTCGAGKRELRKGREKKRGMRAGSICNICH